jgi:hypothetical protein
MALAMSRMNEPFDFADVPREMLAQAQREIDEVLGSGPHVEISRTHVRIAMIAAYVRGAGWMRDKVMNELRRVER